MQFFLLSDLVLSPHSFLMTLFMVLYLVFVHFDLGLKYPHLPLFHWCY